jgi:hypothetical protein
VLAGLGAAIAFIYRLRNPPRREKVDLYFEDGSLTELPADDVEGATLLSLARAVRYAAG